MMLFPFMVTLSRAAMALPKTYEMVVLTCTVRWIGWALNGTTVEPVAMMVGPGVPGMMMTL